ncbi:MAG: hypothetical protein AAB091_02490, partial [Elusimicrobiota bacterium]
MLELGAPAQSNSAAAANTATSANLIFKVGNSGATTAMTILNNGNVGIGATVPGTMLEIFGTTNKLRLAYDATRYSDLSTDVSGNLNISATGTVNVGTTGSDVIIGAVGSAANLVFEESSAIKGQGTNTITFGQSGDTFAMNVTGVTYNFGTLGTASGNLIVNSAANFEVQDPMGVGTNAPTGNFHSKVSNAAVTTSQYASYFENLATNTTTDGVNKYGAYITSTGSFTGSVGTATNNYGLYVAAPTGADNNYAAVFDGIIGVIETGTTPAYHTFFQGGDQAGDLTYTLPTAYPGANGYALTSTTAGVMSWANTITNPMTTLGDLVYGGAAGTPTRLAGSAGFLTSTGAAAPAWTAQATDYFTQYALLAGRATGQTLIGGTGTTDDLILRTTSGVGASGADMIFQTGNNGGTEAMRILYDGKIGIGTTAPTNILSLGNTQAQKFWIENSATDVAGNALTIASGGTVAGTSVSNVVGGNLILQSGLGTGTGASTISFQTGTTLTTGTTLQTMSTKMTILGNGNVGIGKSDPGSLLTVKGGDIALREDDDGFDAISIYASNFSGAIDYNSGGVTKVTIQGNSDSYFNADNAKVGIGIDASALGKLHTKESGAKTTANYAGYFENIATSSTASINKYGVYVTSTGTWNGTSANNYGLYIATTSGGTANYDIYAQSGANLTTAGTWTNAPSYRRYKGDYTATDSYLDKLMTLDVYEWQYKNKTIDGANRFASDPNRHASPFLDDFYNTFGLGNIDGYNIQDLAGVTIASVKELNQRFINQNITNVESFEALTLKTDENITTLQGLQTSVDEQLAIIQQSIQSQGPTLASLRSDLDQLSVALQAQIDELKKLSNQELNVAQIEANTTDIDYLKTLLGISPTSTPGDISLLGKLEADGVVAGAFTVRVSDADRPTIGAGLISVPSIDEFGNVISDGRTYFIKTKAVTQASRVFVTPKDL